MSDTTRAPEPTVLRLSRYHCFVGELLADAAPARVRSRDLAEQLGIAEETVRRDLSYIDVEGRPGAGYDLGELHDSLGRYLGIDGELAFAAVGSASMLAALFAIFDPSHFGMRVAGLYSCLPEDAGAAVAGMAVRPLEEIGASGVGVTLLACAPEKVDDVLAALDAARIRSVLMLTPVLRPKHPEGMHVTYFRIPCSLKSLASSTPQGSSCCAGGHCGD